jgi:hypothetical protein
MSKWGKIVLSPMAPAAARRAFRSGLNCSSAKISILSEDGEEIGIRLPVCHVDHRFGRIKSVRKVPLLCLQLKLFEPCPPLNDTFIGNIAGVYALPLNLSVDT